jgi:uncharacterized membrane protein (DUF485 family)
MNIFNKLSQEEKYLILVRKLKEAFLFLIQLIYFTLYFTWQAIMGELLL